MSLQRNNENDIKPSRLGKILSKLRQYPATKDVARWTLMLGLAGLTVLGAKGIKTISSSIKYTRTKVASILKEKNQEEAFIRFCYDQQNPAFHVLVEQHNQYQQWTQLWVPKAVDVLSRAGIMLDQNLEEISPQGIIDRMTSHISREPVSQQDIQEALATIAEWKKVKSELEASEQQFRILQAFFTAGKVNEIQKMLEDPTEPTTPSAPIQQRYISSRQQHPHNQKHRTR
jgi:hypothetical protein